MSGDGTAVNVIANGQAMVDAPISPSNAPKIQKSCDQCRARKVKCDGLPTCTKCANRGSECTYNYVFKQREKKHKPEEPIDKPKRKRGRPRKHPLPSQESSPTADTSNNVAPPSQTNLGTGNSSTKLYSLVNQPQSSLTHSASSSDVPHADITSSKNILTSIGRGFLGVKQTPQDTTATATTTTTYRKPSNIDSPLGLSSAVGTPWAATNSNFLMESLNHTPLGHAHSSSYIQNGNLGIQNSANIPTNMQYMPSYNNPQQPTLNQPRQQSMHLPTYPDMSYPTRTPMPNDYYTPSSQKVMEDKLERMEKMVGSLLEIVTNNNSKSNNTSMASAVSPHSHQMLKHYTGSPGSAPSQPVFSSVDPQRNINHIRTTFSPASESASASVPLSAGRTGSGQGKIAGAGLTTSNSNSQIRQSFCSPLSSNSKGTTPTGSRNGNANVNGSINEKSTINEGEPLKTVQESLIPKWNGLQMHTAIFFLTPFGMKVLAENMKDPSALIPLRQVITSSTPCERKVISTWTDPIREEELSPLPSRDEIESIVKFLRISIFISRMIDFEKLTKLLNAYCDHRDGLIPEPAFTYSDYLFMNASLLIACLFISDRGSKVFPITNEGSEFDIEISNLKQLENNLLVNSLFYYHTISVISGDLNGVSGTLLLALYADNTSISRSAYLISSVAIRQAQDLGLHVEESYRCLLPKERSVRINLWWLCYTFDKEMCSRWAQSPLINDNDISAPPLPGFESFWSANVGEEVTKRTKLGIEIETVFEGMLHDLESCMSFEQFIIIDYSFLTSKVYDDFLRTRSLINLSKAEVQKKLADCLDELEKWRRLIPVPLRPTVVDDENYDTYLKKMKLETGRLSQYKMILATGLNVRYHHLKTMLYRAYGKHVCVEFGEDIKYALYEQPIISVRCILRLSCLVDHSFGNYTNYFIFYPFNAFLTVCSMYIYTLDCNTDLIRQDMQLLIDCIKMHVTPFMIQQKYSEKGRLICLVLKSMFYATYKTCVDRFGDIPVDGLEILQEVQDIADGVTTAEEIMRSTEPQDSVGTQRPSNTFVRMPYFPSQQQGRGQSMASYEQHVDMHSEIPHDQQQQQQAQQQDTNRAPTVSFMLSPTRRSESTSHQDPFAHTGELNSKDSIFNNLLSVPNYFMDYMYDGSMNGMP